MSSSKKRLKNAKLYLILDAGVLEYGALLKVLKESVRVGVDIVQLRDKIGSAKDVLSFSRHALKITRHNIPFIVNDRIDIAVLSGADGVHLGQDDIPIIDARRHLKSNVIFGCSCQTLPQALAAQQAGADYIGFGSVYKTLTKPERNPMSLKLLGKVLSAMDVPVFPIGGISRANIASLTKIGVTRAAVCRDILLDRNPAEAVKEFKHLLKGN